MASGGRAWPANPPPTGRLATGGLRLLNFDVEARCTSSRSVVLTGRHAIRSGTPLVPIAGGLDGPTRWAAERASESIVQVVTMPQPPADLLIRIPPGIHTLVDAAAGRH